MTTFDTPQPIALTIAAMAGHVWVRASDRTDTVVEVRPTNEGDDRDIKAVDQTQVEYAQGHLVVKSPRGGFRSMFGRPPSVDVTVEVPTDSRVDIKAWGEVHGEGRFGETRVETGAGSVRLDETGRLKLNTAAGDVSVARATGNAEVTTASGDIRLGAVEGAAVLKTANGDITAGEVIGDLRMHTANGDISVDHALANVAARTAYGGIRVGEVVRGSVTLGTAFGQVEIGVRQGTAAWLDVSSQSGSVRSDLEATDRPASSDDTVEVRARTGFGDILVHRAEVVG